MDPLLLALRIVHIVTSVFWVGGVLVFLFYVLPVSRTLGAEGTRFLDALVQGANLSRHLTRAAALSVLSGAWLLWIVSGGLDEAWLVTRTGTTLATASLAGTFAFLIGMINNGPAAAGLARLASAIEAQGSPPDAAQQAELARLRQRLSVGGTISMVMLGIAVGGMATFRYLGG